ncbi:MAG TPA: zinc-ribbon domain-containing protein [Pyrinomonadaceae bacterium]|nr:zinc-ribbon domain-containing protein [Pyrinomonadaceae bacterium]
MNCPNCHSVLKEGASFCPGCGAPVSQASSPAQSNAGQTYGTSPQSSTPPVQPKRKSRWYLWILALFLLLLVGGAAAVYLLLLKHNSNTSNANSPRNTSQTTAQQNQNAGSGEAAGVAARPAGLVRALSGQSREVTSVAWLHDGRTLATGSLDGTARLWDAQAGSSLQTLDESNNTVVSIAFSSDGQLGAIALDNDGQDTVLIVDTQSGRLGDVKLKLSGENVNNIHQITFSPDGKTLAVGNRNSKLALWDTATGSLKRSLEGQDYFTNSVAFSPDGRTIAAGGYGNTVKLWDAQTGELTRTLEGHTSEINSVAFSPDGQTIASGSIDNTIRLWDARTGALKGTMEEGDLNTVFAVAFAPDGKTIASASHREVKVWDVQTGALKQTFTTAESVIGHSLAFSPDGKLLASAGTDGTVRLWDVSR